MATTTAKGLPFPESTDPDKPRTDIEVLAEFLDQIPGVRAGTAAERDVLTDLWPGLLFFNTTTGRLEINRTGTAGDWVWIIDAAQPVPIANGGTGLSVAPQMWVDLGSSTGASPLQPNPRPGVLGILRIARGGTGGGTAVEARASLSLYSKEEIGEPETNFVALFETARTA